MLNTIFSTRAWALESRYFAQIKPTVLKRIQDGDLTAEVITSEKKADQPLPNVRSVTAANIGAAVAFAAFVAAGGSGLANGDGSSDAKVAVIPLRGPMTKYGGACSYGTTDVREWLAAAVSNPNISAIVLEVDSPGGAVDGTEDLAADVAAATKIKPVIGFVNGMAASAAYWVVSQCSEVFINRATTAWVGSIGTLIAHVDQSKFLEMQGLAVTYITADASTDKVKGNSTQPLDEEATAMFKADLNSINNTFISYVKEGRGERIGEQSSWDSAKVFNGKQGKALGMVDTIGSLSAAIRRAAELSRGNASNKSKKQSSNNDPMKFTGFAEKFPSLAAAIGITAGATEEVTADEAMMANVEKALAGALADKTKVEGELTTANASIKTLTTAKTDLEGKVATLEEWKKNAKGTRAPEGDVSDEAEDKPVRVSKHNAEGLALMKRIQEGK